MTRNEIEDLVSKFDQIARTGNMRASTALLPAIITGMLDMIERSSIVGPLYAGDEPGAEEYITEGESSYDGSDDDGGYEAPVGYDPEAAHELIERINAAPERKVYKIDVGDMAPEEAAAIITEVQKKHGGAVELPESLASIEDAHKGAAIEYAAKMLEASEHREEPADASKAKPKAKPKK